MLGYRKSELTQKSVSDLNEKFQGDIWFEHWQTIKTKNSEILETTHRARDGQMLPVEVSANYIFFDNHEYNCAIVRDIRNRKLAEAQLQQRNRILEEAQLAAHMGCYVTDLDSERWTSSPMLDKIMGIDTKFERSVANWAEMVHPNNRAQALNEFRYAIEKQEQFHHSYRFIRPEDRRTVWLDAWGMIDYENGRPRRLIGAVMDITKRKETDLELERYRQDLESLVTARTAALAEKSAELTVAEERLRLAMAATRDGLWDLNIKTIESYVNAAYYEMLGYEVGELSGHLNDQWLALMHPDDREIIFRKANEALRNSGHYELEFRLRAKDGSNPLTKDLPVIALTAGVLEEERKTAIDAGANDFLAKPLDLKIMKSALLPFKKIALS